MHLISEDVSLSHRNVVLPSFCCLFLMCFIVVAFQLSTAIWKTIYLLPFYTQFRSFFYSAKGNWKWLIIVNGVTCWRKANKDTHSCEFYATLLREWRLFRKFFARNWNGYVTKQLHFFIFNAQFWLKTNYIYCSRHDFTYKYMKLGLKWQHNCL